MRLTLFVLILHVGTGVYWAWGILTEAPQLGDPWFFLSATSLSAICGWLSYRLARGRRPSAVGVSITGPLAFVIASSAIEPVADPALGLIASGLAYSYLVLFSLLLFAGTWIGISVGVIMKSEGDGLPKRILTDLSRVFRARRVNQEPDGDRS
ncbi:MAG: hypothetical protein IPN03_08240 [Holophagales bacterium]|nr:hypothetical protein [Holophagales bacterium]